MRFPLFCLLILPLYAAAGTVNFSREIRPILSENCFFCHGPDEAKREADLRLDIEASAKQKHEGGAAIVPGHPESSTLIERLTTTDPDDVMPPPKLHKTVTPAQVALLRQWIAEGAPWGKHWSYEKIVRPETPRSAGKSANPIDAFLQARLTKEGLKPSPQADAPTLLRRLALDLTGLPPTLEEIDRFVPAFAKGGYESVADYYLSRPGYGEHWARLWLDLARYADSAGYPSDPGREIWAYRDWVIDAFNHNMPFDEFTIEQMAGDLLPHPTDSQWIATAFHRNTMTQNEGGTSDEEFRVAAIIDRVNTTFAVWMGTTMACAQCHNHKYDPLSQKEYFQFYDLLNQTADADRKDESPLHSFYTAEQSRQRESLSTELAALEARFQNPGPEWLAGLEGWQAGLTKNLGWKSPKPLVMKTAQPNQMNANADGVVTVGKRNDTETCTVELPVSETAITAIQLETFPGAAKGNFVITGLQAELIQGKDARPPSARFVRIELPGKKRMLQLAEVQAFSGSDNVARNGSAKQSSLYADAEARRAIDGGTNGEYAKGSVAHTSGNEDDPWWEVDLKAPQAIDRVVVWNRTDGGVGKRLEGFRVVLLDEKRRPVWSRENIPAPAEEVALGTAEAVPLTFTTALADYEQAGFPAASLLNAAPQKGRGWAVAGAADKPHTLTLLTNVPAAVPKGAQLRVTIQQQSPYPKHVLSAFRVGFTSAPGAREVARMPADLLAALRADQTRRTDSQRHAVTDYYVRNVSPATLNERRRKDALDKQLADVKAVTVPVMLDLPAKERRKTNIQLRGNWQALGDEVSADVPAIFGALPEDAPRNRLTLAKWLVSRDNPLTARVAVNRLWEAIFGYGIVRSSEEFGSQGDLPVHPELLDWLAAEFMDSGWDVKHLLKLMVMTDAYRQSSASTPELNERDPDNRLLARGPRFRPTGEMLRDQALAVSGLLSPKMHGKPVRPLRPNLELNTAFGGKNDWETSAGEDRYRRSVYTETKRNSPYPSFTTFDAPNREVCTIRRGRTNTPLQAFVTLNDPVFVETNQAMARRIMAEAGQTADARISYLFKLCLARQPTAPERAALTRLLAESLEAYRADPAAADKMATDPLGPAPKGMNMSELAAWSTVANVVMNLDEFVMRK